MNRSTHLFIFGFLSLLVFFISGTFAACNANIAANCNCNPENIKGCDASGSTVERVICGRGIGCDLLKDRFQVDANGNFCHIGTCSRECVSRGTGDSTCSTGQ
jgi:hypothetical protein